MGEKQKTEEHNTRRAASNDDIANTEMLKQSCYHFSNAKEILVFTDTKTISFIPSEAAFRSEVRKCNKLVVQLVF